MANPDHLKIFKAGVETWNAWRRENPSIKPDLSQEHIGGDLTGINFSYTDFTGSTLCPHRFEDANCQHAKFTRTLFIPG